MGEIDTGKARTTGNFGEEIPSDRGPRRRAALLIGAMGLMAVGAAVVVSGALADDDGGVPRAERTVFSHPMYVAPFDTADEVLGSADRVVVATVTDQDEIPEDGVPEARAEAGEGTVGRTISLRVDDVLWESEKAERLEDRFETRLVSWVRKNHERSRLVMSGSPWPEVGETYVLPLGTYQGEYAPLWPASFPVRDGVVVTAPGQETPLSEQLAGSTVREVGEVYATAARGRDG